METPIICETPRLILRQFNESDVDALLGFRSDPEVMRFSVRGPETREDIQTGISIIESENTASIRVAEKIGMTLEKRASFHNVPVLIYSVANAVTGVA